MLSALPGSVRRTVQLAFRLPSGLDLWMHKTSQEADRRHRMYLEAADVGPPGVSLSFLGSVADDCWECQVESPLTTSSLRRYAGLASRLVAVVDSLVSG
jgi:hypothetical protein